MRAVAVVLAVAALALLAWSACEAHYQSCVARAEAITPEIARPSTAPLPLDQPPPRAVSNGARLRAIDSCSRLPF
jgi:hypothetical protein